MKKDMIIGVITKKMNNEKDLSMAKSFNLEQPIYNYIKRENVSIIGICANEDEFVNKKILDFCDGFIFQGGDYDICEYHHEIFKYAYENNKPVLGICLGMQFLGMYSLNTNKMGKVAQVSDKSHMLKDTSKSLFHTIKTTEGTILNKIFKEVLEVNSRHNDCIFDISDEFIVSAYSEDGIIEGIELKDKNKFMVGVQWHPESDIMKDKGMDKLVTEFLNYIK